MLGVTLMGCLLFYYIPGHYSCQPYAYRFELFVYYFVTVVHYYITFANLAALYIIYKHCNGCLKDI